MTRDKRAINILLVLLVLSLCFSTYALLGKKNTAAPIFLFMHDRNRRFSGEDSLSKPNFWDNYPYYVLISMDKSIHLEKYIDAKSSVADTNGINQALKDSNSLYFRYIHVPKNDSIDKELIQPILNLQKPLVILVDDESEKQLKGYLQGFKADHLVIAKESGLPVYLEKVKVSYFFTVSSSNTLKNLFVPRVEIPELTEKYINYLSKNRH